MAPKSSTALLEGELELGHISGVFGVRGEVRLFLHNRESDLFRQERKVTLVSEDGTRSEHVLSARSGAGKRVLGRVEGITTPETARTLMGSLIVVTRDELPAPKQGEFYVRDVIGVPVRVGGVEVGTLVDVHASGPIDVLEVDTDDGPEFVPAVGAVVLSITAEGVELAAGALDGEAPE